MVRRTVERRPLVERVTFALVVAIASMGSGPAGAIPSAKPRVHVASGTHLQSLTRIAELSASGSQVAAITEQGSRYCDHLLAWRAGTTRVIQFPARSCRDNGYLAVVTLVGIRVTWYEIAYGNSSYWTLFTADVRRPQTAIEGDEQSGDHGEEPGRPPPERGKRRGVTMTVRTGAVVLTRADGKKRTIHAAGVVDAELEEAGLFYAFNGPGPRPGNIVFVPFAKLFA
jgi:hypothetical protein